MKKPSKPIIPRPSEWVGEHFYIPKPRDPVTGAFYSAGPIRLSTLQARIIDEALSRNENGLLKYTTVIYSTIKKSGKSALASAVGLYMAEQVPFGHVYCLGNDGKNSNDRLFTPMKTCITLHNRMGGLYKGIRASRAEVVLDNGTKIEAIPCDAAGEAGGEPTMTLFTELWGFDTDAKRHLFTEMTVPSTLFGLSIRWIETYAGYSGVSDLLEGLYEQAVKEGIPHPDFLDITSEGEPVVWTNEAAGLFCYWDHEPRMPWQLGSEGERYYQQEAKILDPTEFRRIHKNQWVSKTGAFIQPEWWDACQDQDIKPLTDSTVPVVVAIDAAETNDCAAIVAVTRHPLRPDTDVAVRACKIFKPSTLTSTILLEPTIGFTLLLWSLKWNIVVVGYDAYQMAKMAQDYKRGNLTIDPDKLTKLSAEIGASKTDEALQLFKKSIQRWYCKFSQQTGRSVADKQLFDMIVHRQLGWNPNDNDTDIAARGNEETLTKHIKQAGSSSSKGQYRIEKLSDKMKIDAAVALSMASSLCLRLNLTNKETEIQTPRIDRAQDLTYEEYARRLFGIR